jgi:hypothetical protein
VIGQAGPFKASFKLHYAAAETDDPIHETTKGIATAASAYPAPITKVPGAQTQRDRWISALFRDSSTTHPHRQAKHPKGAQQAEMIVSPVHESRTTLEQPLAHGSGKLGVCKPTLPNCNLIASSVGDR